MIKQIDSVIFVPREVAPLTSQTSQLAARAPPDSAAILR